MKKKLALLLACMLLLSLVGCGDSQTGSDNNTQASSELPSDATDGSESNTENSSESTPVPAAQLSLRELFSEHGMKVGTCLTTQMIGNAVSSKLILKQFNSVTMENDMKPDSFLNKTETLKSGELVVKFNSNSVKMLKWAKENNMSVRGHTLVWYSQTPEWLFHEDFDENKALVGREVMLERMESMIKQVFTYLIDEGYADMFYAFDVANECWMEDGSMRVCNWRTIIGDDYLWHAFNFARKYAPANIKLFYNDYNEQFKTQTLVNFVKTLVDDDGNSLIDGVGFQAHLYTKDSLTDYFQTMDALSQTGLIIELTELDVCLGAYQNTLEANEQNLKTQGRFYYDLVHGIFERVDAGTLQTDALTFWGYSDGQSWRSEASPLLYDKKNKPKYAYYGAMQIKEQAGFDE